MSNIKNFLIKIAVLSLLVVLMFSTSVNAFNMSSLNMNSLNLGSLSGLTSMGTSLSIENIMKKLGLNFEMNINSEDFLTDTFGFMGDYDYNFEDLEMDLSGMLESGTGNVGDIQGLLGKLPEGFGSNVLGSLLGKFSNINISSLLTKLLDMVDLLLNLDGLGFDIGGGSSSSLPEAQDVYVDAVTAAEFTGEVVQLHGQVYLNEASNNWAILIHPFAFTGESIAPKIGPNYYELGYNLLAIDLRGFGDSDGSMAMGFLDGLDVYDWLEKLNAEYKPDNVFIHGISLGGGTTNFVSGIDQFMEQAPADIRIDKDFKSLEELHVVGLVADSAFVDMTAIGASESMLLGMNVGLNEDNIDYYSQATNSLKYCKLPILLIHGTSDSTVKFEQAQKAQAAVATPAEDVHTYYVEGAVHAFIVMGGHAEEYKTNVQNFVTQYQR